MKICSQARTLIRWGLASGLFFQLLMAASTESRGQDFTYTINNGTITITGYNGPYNGPTGPFLQVMIPGTINGLPVTSIGRSAFSYGCLPGCYNLTNITIPESVTSIVPPLSSGGGGPFGGCFRLTRLLVDPVNSAYSDIDGVLFSKSRQTLIECPPAKAGSYNIPNGVTDIAPGAFAFCSSLGTVTLPETVTNIGVDAFQYFSALTNITIPDSVRNIGTNAFAECIELSDVTIGSGVTNIDDHAFADCTNLHRVYFKGNAPTISPNSFFGINYFSPRIYYLPGTSGWGSIFGGFPTVLWNPQAVTHDGNFGVQQGRFGFNIGGTPDIPVVVEASTDLRGQSWTALQSFTLTNGLVYFNDLQWTNFPGRYYRIRSP